MMPRRTATLGKTVARCDVLALLKFTEEVLHKIEDRDLATIKRLFDAVQEQSSGTEWCDDHLRLFCHHTVEQLRYFADADNPGERMDVGNKPEPGPEPHLAGVHQAQESMVGSEGLAELGSGDA